VGVDRGNRLPKPPFLGAVSVGIGWPVFDPVRGDEENAPIFELNLEAVGSAWIVTGIKYAAHCLARKRAIELAAHCHDFPSFRSLSTTRETGLVLWHVQAGRGKAGGFLLGGNSRLEATRDAPAEGATQRVALADALRWTLAAPTGWIVATLGQRHGGSLRPLSPTLLLARTSQHAGSRNLFTASITRVGGKHFPVVKTILSDHKTLASLLH
jgi:hypothetical protein